MITYPNQKIIHINKETSSNFLQVDKDAWMNASENLTYNAFRVYLYLAGNQNGFDLALSKKAIQAEIKMHDNTYKKVIKELQETGYLVQKQGNIYDFFTVPGHSSGIGHSDGMVHSSVPEIDKKDKIDIFYIKELPKAAAPIEEKRDLTELSTDELKSLKQDFENETKYPVLYEKYNLRKGQLDKNLLSTIKDVLSDRYNAEKQQKIKEN